MSPELQILSVNATILATAYLGIYPTMRQRTLNRMLRTDLVLTGIALVTAWGLFGGARISFDALLFDTNWFLFSLLSLSFMETPLFLWFCKRNGIDLTAGDEQ
ncbi:hypothetical protein [Paracoccus sediminicola]|uniref:hypothetical protein n=1 Tax=Paracoccus sediminicola TaxID=3017783 RepID=UPI0022F0DF40|nr:hypothetical protein [Paracoccus sediminicola]WBU57210.1 hypothetical protein PAF18_01815 [Paracoccus sediminicola]